MLRVILTISLACAASGSVTQHNPFYCFSSDPIRPQLGMFSTRSSYDTNRGRIFDTTASTCTPTKFWFLSRHGSRLPATATIESIRLNHERLQREIINNYNAGRASLCAADFDLIRNWKFNTNITTDKAMFLTTSGWTELEGIGRRFSEAFPTLLQRNYSRDDFLFRATDTQRTRASLQAFADGVFGPDAHMMIELEEATEPDLLLYPSINCELYDEVIAKNAEQNAFKDGPEYQQMLTQVSEKLGFIGSRHLREEEIVVIQNLCQFEHTWYPDEPSPWCVAFSVGNYQVLEYFEDLFYYWSVGYGHWSFRTLFENLNCHLMQNLLTFVTSADPNDHLARMFSTHTPTLQLLLVTLGVFEDETPLTRHNFAQQTFRAWRSSNHDPMASNFAIIKYACADGDDDLLFLLNERPLHIDGCQLNGLCKQSLIVDRFTRFMEADCSKVFCSNTNTSKK